MSLKRLLLLTYWLVNIYLHENIHWQECHFKDRSLRFASSFPPIYSQSACSYFDASFTWPHLNGLNNIPQYAVDGEHESSDFRLFMFSAFFKSFHRFHALLKRERAEQHDDTEHSISVLSEGIKRVSVLTKEPRVIAIGNDDPQSTCTQS